LQLSAADGTTSRVQHWSHHRSRGAWCSGPVRCRQPIVELSSVVRS